MSTTIKINNFTIDGDVHIVLINEEGQYSIWPAAKEPPAGWKQVGPTGSKAECSAYVDQNWIDMRPLSLQKAMADNKH